MHLLAFKSGFNSFIYDNRNKEYFIKILMKSCHLKCTTFTSGMEKELNDTITKVDVNSFYHKINNLLDLLNKSNVFKIFMLLGLVCVVLGISTFPVPESYCGLVTKIAGFYLLCNLVIKILQIVTIFSRLFRVFDNEFSIMWLFSSWTEKAFFLIGFFLHFLIEILKSVFGLILQCYIIDLYCTKLDINKIFDLDRYIVNKDIINKDLNSRSERDIDKTLNTYKEFLKNFYIVSDIGIFLGFSGTLLVLLSKLFNNFK